MMGKREKYNLEFKSDVTRTFLKTVSAFANYNDGKIVFGIDDGGTVIGLHSAKEDSLRVENMINDSIDPVPVFKIEVKTVDGKNIIELYVKKGLDTPYFYHGKAYKRSDTSTTEMDRFELRRLTMEGFHMNYEEKKASSQDLEFKILESKLKEKTGIEHISLDILRTLELYTKEGYYNVAGELLADQNDVEFSGIDIARFGKNINQILYRELINKNSLLAQYDKAIELYRLYYQYEEVEGFSRVRKELIPQEAFRESLANAIVHRIWDINATIRISMFDDGIEIHSPVGLPEGVSEEEYLNRPLSVLRNPIIAGVFYRLDIIEKFGTGITRINREYSNSLTKPSFMISQNSIRIQLPVVKTDQTYLLEEEIAVYNIIKDERELTRAELDRKTGFNKAKTIRTLNKLIDKNIIRKEGKGPGTTYSKR